MHGRHYDHERVPARIGVVSVEYSVAYPEWLGANPFAESAMKGYLPQVAISTDSGTFLVDFYDVEGFAREMSMDVERQGYASVSNVVFVRVVERGEVQAAIAALASQGFSPLKPEAPNPL